MEISKIIANTCQQNSLWPGTLYRKCVVALNIFVALVLLKCGSTTGDTQTTSIKISVVNAPSDIVTVGAHYLAKEIQQASEQRIETKVFHSGVLSGGKGEAEIEMCQQGSIEMHITSTAYLANLVPKTSIVSLPFLFRDIEQVTALTKSKSPTLDSINSELNDKNLNIIAWWPRGFRQLTNSKAPVQTIDDMRGLKLRVMNNPLYADNMKAMSANPVPMAWGEVYNGLQLKTIDGQENAEDVIYTSKLFEAQKYMTIWDYSIDLEVVLVNLGWWRQLREEDRQLIQKIAVASVSFEENLLKQNTIELRKKISEEGMQIHYLDAAEKARFRTTVAPVWRKYEKIFGKPFLDAFLAELEKY
ncbi:MAG: TRAP transporter substrate-binding protein [Cyclobacteriaceae bacterium]